jgi:ABC-type multidrug transport system ATPase subunit
MMLLDVIWLGFVSWYISQTWPSEFGTHKKWYFIFEPSYWVACGRSIIGLPLLDPRTYSQANATDDENNIELTDIKKEKNKFEEDVDENLKSQVDSKLCVTISNLFKGFQTPTGFKAAVDDFSLTMYSGQITALLGHNGAGKSTVISMLTGLFPPDKGTSIINGYDICTDMDSIRGNLGVCPQHDILFPDLTVLEHLTMFASFKGVPKEELESEVDKMILSIGLTEKKNEYSKFLSGGQKRKLSVGIAFIGGSKIVFLDEPTSGMDPYSRRFTWNVIRQYREGRVVVLTTHFMDEADLLGDRIAIMGDGQLKCVGSSLFLKNIFGVGYNMTLEKKSAINFDSNSIVSLLSSYVPECNVLTDVGTELTVQLPFSSSDKFQTLFEYIDSNIDTLGLQSYGISVTTLEEVFIKIANSTTTIKVADKGKIKEYSEEIEKIANADDKRSVKPSDINITKTQSFKKIKEDDQYAVFFQHLHAMIIKRSLYFVRDTKAWIYQYFVPILFVLTGSLITYFTFPYQYQPPLSYDVHSIYNQGINTNIMPTPYMANSTACNSYFPPPDYEETKICQNVVSPLSLSQEWNQSGIMSNVPDGDNLPLYSGEDINSILDMSTYLQGARDMFKASHFGAISFNSISEEPNTANSSQNDITIDYNIHGNYTALHAGPIFNNILVQGVLRNINPDVTLTNGLYVFPLTSRQETILSNFNVDLIVTFIILASPFIPAAISTYIVREREVKTKHQQIVSGISIPAYWLSNWIFDFISFVPTVIMIVILLVAFPDTELLSGPTEVWATIMILLLFGTAVSGFSYIFSFIFSTPASAQVSMLFLNFVLGLIMNIAGIVLRFIPSTRDAYFSTIRYIFMIFPAFAMGEGLHNLALIDVYSNFELDGGEIYNVYDWKIVGCALTFLTIQSVVFLGSTILYEYLSAQPAIQQLFDMHTSLPSVDVSNLKDSDVLEEERAVLSNEKDDSTILVKDFKKIFPPNHSSICKKAEYDSNGELIGNYGKYAVRGLSVGIPNGECFGLLGINGAGKSTTLSMLSGEFRPTSGDASVSGLNLLTDVHSCRRKIGFCPQFDALFELLTAREHLELYARIKGIYYYL